MKRLILALEILFVLFCSVAMADTLKFAWDDANQKSEGFGWHLYMSDISGQYDYTSPIVTINWTSNLTVFETTQTIPVIGVPNSQIIKYFVLRAFDANSESSDSNEVSKVFTVDKSPPFGLTIDVVVLPSE